MENQIPAYEGNLIYDFEETDPRYCVEFLEPCPNLSPNTTVNFDGFFGMNAGLFFNIMMRQFQASLFLAESGLSLYH